MVMQNEIHDKSKKWYNRTIYNRVIIPLILTAIALYILVALKHYGYIH